MAIKFTIINQHVPAMLAAGLARSVYLKKNKNAPASQLIQNMKSLGYQEAEIIKNRGGYAVQYVSLDGYIYGELIWKKYGSVDATFEEAVTFASKWACNNPLRFWVTMTVEEV